jgi:hypothetical protein
VSPKTATKPAPTWLSLMTTSLVTEFSGERRRVLFAETEKYIPIVTHRLEDSIIKFNGPRNEQSGVGWLTGHFDGLS